MKKLENNLKIINETVLNYYKKEEYEKVTLNSKMKAYNLISELLDDNLNSGKKLYFYFIDYFIQYSKEIFKKLDEVNQNNELINHFILEYKKYNKFAFYIIKLFKLVEKRYAISNNIILLNEIVFGKFKLNVFIPLRDKIYQNLNNILIRDKKLQVINSENIKYVKYIYSIFEKMNFTKPNLIKISENEYEWKDDKINDIKQIEKYINECYEKFQIQNIEYIREKSKEYFKDLNIENYSEKLNQILTEEKKYIKEYIYKGLQKTEIMNIEKEYILIASYKISNWRQIFEKALDGNDIEKIKFFRNILHLNIFKKNIPNIFINFIEKKFNNIIQHSENIIPSLLELIQCLNNIIDNGFHSNNMNKIKENCLKKLLKGDFYVRELVNYFNHQLTDEKNSLLLNSDYLNKFNQINYLIYCLPNKLSLEHELSRKLTTRLIYDESFSLEKEKEFLSLIKKSISKSSIKKMNSMIDDVENSIFYLTEFYENSIIEDYDYTLTIKILSIDNFEIPLNKKFNIPIPKSLSNTLDNFVKYYSNKGHSLKWYYSYFTLNINYLCFDKQYKSISTLIQYNILLTLEKNKKLNIIQISEILNLPVYIIIDELYGLAKINNKNWNGIIKGDFENEILDTSIIELNDNFSVDFLFFNTINNVYIEKEEEIMDERQKKNQQMHILQSTITRILKNNNKKSINYETLYNKIIKEIYRFEPSKEQINENLEKLIERQIIGKEENNSNNYFYIP